MTLETCFLSALLFVAACGGHSSSSTDSSPTEPPITIRDLSLSPTSVPVGKATAVTGQLTFDAPGADVDELVVDVALPTGGVQHIPPSKIPSAQGTTGGPLEVLLVVSPPVPGAYPVTIHLSGSDGSVSNALTTTIAAQ